MELVEFDQQLEAARSSLLRRYEHDARKSWIEYMCGEAVNHRRRLAYTMTLVDAVPGRVLDVGANVAFTAMYSNRRRDPVEMINYGALGGVEWMFGDRAVPMRLLDIQRDPFPYPEASFDGVFFFEVLEHLSIDPMKTMAEINRVTRPGGTLLLSTPNIISYRSIAAAIQGRHPHLSSQYLRNSSTDRHNREYMPTEIAELVESSGYKIEWIGTPSVYSEVREFAALAKMLQETDRSETMRGDTIAVRAIKTGPVAVRHPRFLYFA